MSAARRAWLVAASAAVAFGGLLHVGAIVGGPPWFEFLGAPERLVEMAAAGLPRPPLSAAIIAAVLFVMAAYGFVAAGVLRLRLPLLRTVLALFGAGLVVRGFALAFVAGWRPHLLIPLCGRCGSLNGFVVVTSALCLAVGVAYLMAALRRSGVGTAIQAGPSVPAPPVEKHRG